MDYLYKVFLLIPLVNFLAIFLKKNNSEIDMRFSLNVSKLTCLIFLAFLMGISTRQNVNVSTLLYFNEFLALKFIFNKGSILIAYAIAISWISIIFYVEKMHEVKAFGNDITSFLKYLPLSILSVTMLNFSFTIYAAIFAFSISILLLLMILLKHLRVNDSRREIFYMIFFLSQVVILFAILAIVSRYSLVPDLVTTFFPLAQSSKQISLLIFSLIFLILLINFIIPVFFILRNRINCENFNIFTVFFINFGLAQVLFLKYVAEIFFGVGIFSDFLANYFISIAQTVFICSIIASLVLLIITKNISQIFFLILYNQISVTMLAIFVDFSQDGKLSSRLIFAFILFSTLFFMVLNNLIAYMDRIKAVNLNGSFAHFKVNIIIVGFCFLNLASLFPPNVINSIDLVFLSKDLQYNTTMLVFIINSGILLLIGLKIILPTFQYEVHDEEGDEQDDLADQQEAKKIDFSSKLTLTPLAMAFIMIVSIFVI